MVDMNFNPKPAYQAAATLISQLNGMTFSQRLDVGNDDYFAFQFENSGDVCYVVWAVGGAAVFSFPSNSCFKVVNYVGNSMPQVCPHRYIYI